MKAKVKDSGEIIDLAEKGVVVHDGRRFAWHHVELLPESDDDIVDRYNFENA